MVSLHTHAIIEVLAVVLLSLVSNIDASVSQQQLWYFLVRT